MSLTASKSSLFLSHGLPLTWSFCGALEHSHSATVAPHTPKIWTCIPLATTGGQIFSTSCELPIKPPSRRDGKIDRRRSKRFCRRRRPHGEQAIWPRAGYGRRCPRRHLCRDEAQPIAHAWDRTRNWLLIRRANQRQTLARSNKSGQSKQPGAQKCHRHWRVEPTQARNCEGDTSQAL
jgi:hypothetical protein